MKRATGPADFLNRRTGALGGSGRGNEGESDGPHDEAGPARRSRRRTAASAR
ncbi:hypothetical protein EDD98_6723 [Streptomyces sp. PanSC19]|nr:hypothetical protein EDD98_6723 [Streptomyces sp. PanSC19]